MNRKKSNTYVSRSGVLFRISEFHFNGYRRAFKIEGVVGSTEKRISWNENFWRMILGEHL